MMPNPYTKITAIDAHGLFLALVTKTGDKKKNLANARALMEPAFDEMFQSNPVRLLLQAAMAIIDKRDEHAELIIAEIGKYSYTAEDVKRLNAFLSDLKEEKHFNLLKDHIKFVLYEKKNGYVRNTIPNFQKFIDTYGYPTEKQLKKARKTMGISERDIHDVLTEISFKQYEANSDDVYIPY